MHHLHYECFNFVKENKPIHAYESFVELSSESTILLTMNYVFTKHLKEIF